MSNPIVSPSDSSQISNSSINKFLNRVYLWMVAGLVGSTVSAYYVLSHPAVLRTVASSGNYMVLILLQLVAVIVFSALARKQNPTLNMAIYAVYSLLTGVTLSIVALIYTSHSIVSAFAATAIGFLGLSIYGRVTKKDLSGIGTFCMMGLFGMIGVMLLSFFIPGLQSNAVQLTFSAIGVIVFSGLTAWDTQKLKRAYKALPAGNANAESALAISGALTLYLDFINLFLSLLRLSGSRR